MQLTEYVAQYLRGEGFPFATSGMMPPSPDRMVTVYATGLMPRRNEDGSRFQVMVRSAPDYDTGVADAMTIAELLDDFEGILTIDSPYIQRIVLEGGVANLGADENRCLLYSINFRAYEC